MFQAEAEDNHHLHHLEEAEVRPARTNVLQAQNSAQELLEFRLAEITTQTPVQSGRPFPLALPASIVAVAPV